jgi:pilus assembly protein CpaB
VASIGAAQYVKMRAANAERQVRNRYEVRSVVVASRDVRRGQRLDGSTLAIREMPRDFLPSDAVAPSDAGQLLGYRTAIDMRRGTTVVPAALQAAAVSEPLASQLAPGKRALTIHVDQVNSLAGQLNTGDRIDLFYSMNQQASALLIPLLQNVQVLATGADRSTWEAGVSPSDIRPEFDSLTLLVSAEEAARVVLAEQTGHLTVLLRAVEDAAPVDVWTRDSRQLMRVTETRSTSVPRRRIELLTGGNGEVEPSRSWLTIGNKVAGTSGEEM